MPWRMARLNLEQNHKRWEARRELVIDQLAALHPDVVALNEICIPLQTGRWLQRVARERLGLPFALLQQSKVNGSPLLDGEALLTRYPVVETANGDYRTLDAVAQVSYAYGPGAHLPQTARRAVGGMACQERDPVESRR